MKRIDSLSHQAAVSTPAEKPKILNELGWEYRKSNPDSTLYYCQMAWDLALSSDITSTRATSLNMIGVAYHYKGEYSNAYQYFNEAHRYAEENDDPSQYAHALNNLGRLFFIQGDLVQSYEYYFNALEIFKQVKDNDGIAHAYKSLGNLFKTEKNYSKALEMLGKAKEIRENEVMGSSQISIITEMAETYELQNNFDKAKEYYYTAESISKSIGDSISMAMIKIGISSLHFKIKEYNSALSSAINALHIIEKGKNRDLLSKAYFQIGRTYFQLKDYTNAQNYFEKTITLTEKSGVLKQQSESYRHLSDIARINGDIDEAFTLFRLHAQYKDSSDNMDKAKSIELLTARLEVEKLNTQFEKLKAKELQDQQTIEYEKTKNLTQTAIIVLVAFLALTLYMAFKRGVATAKSLESKTQKIEAQNQEIFQQNKRIQNQNEKLQRRNEKLSELNQDKDNLMNVVAHDLKAPFNKIQGLVGLIELSGPMNEEQKEIARISKTTATEGVNLITDLLDATAFESNHRLHPSTFELSTFLEERITEFKTESTSKGIRIEKESEEDIYLYTDKEYLIRIVDNLVSNAIKYSHPNTKIQLGSSLEDSDTVRIFIKDEGPGFSDEDKKLLYKKFQKLSAKPTAGESSNGLGLAIVKTLVDRLKCQIQLISEQGKGSEFILKIPKSLEITKPVSVKNSDNLTKTGFH